MGNDNTIVYNKEYFLNSTGPFEEVYGYIDEPFIHLRELEKMTELASNVGVRNFKKMYESYVKMQKSMSGQLIATNVSNFDNQEIELNTGRWLADDGGVSTIGPRGEEIVACRHPLMITRRLVNIDTGIEKIEIAWSRGFRWRKMICDRKQIMSSKSIIELADSGIGVTTENARYIVQYLHDIESENYDVIPEGRSASRLGWLEGEGFAPYVDGLEFDGDANFKHFFESVSQKGDFNKWLNAVKQIRAEGNVPAKILIAASFSSALVKVCNCLPFFVHLWGGTEAGKTVGLMLAASVWANPEMGKYIHTFNSTAVAQELSASFVNSLPLMLDELQIVKDRKDFDQMIYQLSEGVGRSRGQKTGGLQKMNTWSNCIITTGEQPISNSSSGGGAINRIIEISCEDTKLFNNPAYLVELLRNNHGHAGKMFVQALMNDESLIQIARDTQKDIFKRLTGTEITEKQALAASLILTADALTDAIIFQDGNGLEIQEVAQFLSTHKEVSVNDRAFEWLKGWVAENLNHFNEEADNIDVWGKVREDGSIAIINKRFDSACADNGFNPQAFKSWLRRKDFLDPNGSRFTRAVFIRGIGASCVVIKGLVEFQEVENKFDV